MKVIIAGTRTITDKDLVFRAIESSGFDITEVLSGAAKGVDSIGEDWAIQHGIDIKRYFPEWDKYDKAAGPIRNARMIEDADALIAVWDEKSKGTKDIIDKAIKKGLPTYVYSSVKMTDLFPLGNLT